MKTLLSKLHWYLLGLGLVLAGLSLLYFGFYGQTLGHQPWPAQPMLTVKAVPVDNQPNTMHGLSVPYPGQAKPLNLSIPDAQINLTIADGHYDPKSQTWTLSPDKAHFALISSKPNTERGQTFIYGHNRNAVFTRLNQVKPTSLVYLTTTDNVRYTYRFQGSYSARPTDGSVFNYDGRPILTLQTCSGAAFQNRTLYKFGLVETRHV